MPQMAMVKPWTTAGLYNGRQHVPALDMIKIQCS